MPVYIEHKYLLPNKYSSVGFQILMYCYANDFPLSQGEIKALSIFYIHGVTTEAENKITEEKIFSSGQSLKNLKSKLVKLGIIKKENKIYKIENFMNVGADEQIAISVRAGNK